MKDNKGGKAVLALEDGTLFTGRSVGADGERVGEVCFNTSMTGYQEILTDPSYAGQIITMTTPMIGNVGANKEDMESHRSHVMGFVMREYSPIRSNWRSGEDLDTFLKRYGIPAIDGIDTRMLTRILRDKGAQRGVISTVDFNPRSLMEKACAWPGLKGMDLASAVTCDKVGRWQTARWTLEEGHREVAVSGERLRVAVIDFGVKYNILRSLVSAGCDLTIYPAATAAARILEDNPDGILLSNGPGDPEAVQYGIETIRALLQSGKPLFGICLGHQMLCLAMGAESEKMKFGHRGGNHPVQHLPSGRVEVTSQNHGFVIREESLPDTLAVTHRSLFDGSLEGVRHRQQPVFSVQFHPEASPGPHDSHHLFREFTELMRGR